MSETPSTNQPATSAASTASQPSGEPASQAATSQPSSEPTPTTEPAAAKKEAFVDLLNDPKFKDDGKTATEAEKKTEPATPADMKKYLVDKKVDEKTLEGKTEAEIKALFDAEKAKETADNKEGEKIEYKDFTVPEDMPIAPDTLAEFKAFATENKLTQEAAQKFIDLGVKQQEKSLEFWQNTKKSWRTDSERDPVIGGDKLKTSVNNANDIVRRFASDPNLGGSPELLKEYQEDLILLGLGNKKSYIKVMNNIHKMISDDSFQGSNNGGAPKSKTMAQTLYPNMVSSETPT